MIESLVFFLIFPLLFSGICILSYWIRKNERYDVLFLIGWESMAKKDRKKLMNLITSILIIYGTISMMYFPISHYTSLNTVYSVGVYFALVIVMTILVVASIIRYSKW